MKNVVEFLKKHFVLIICIVVAVAALGAGIWFLVSPEQPEVPDPNSQTESTGDLGVDLDTDMGFGDLDMGSGIVNIPSGDQASGEVTPITPDGKNENTGGEEGENSAGSENAQPESGNSDQGSQQAPSGSGNQSTPQTGTVEMSGGVVENPFN